MNRKIPNHFNFIFMEYNYDYRKYKTNMICRFDGLCWDEEHRKGMNYEDYKKNKQNKNTDFWIEFTIKENIWVYKTINIFVHLWDFSDDYEIKVNTKSLANMFDEYETRDFLERRNLVNYIKDELNYHCGIVDEFLTEKIIQTLCKEMIV